MPSWLGAHHVSKVWVSPPSMRLLSEEGTAGTCPPRALQMVAMSLTLRVFMATQELVGGKGRVPWAGCWLQPLLWAGRAGGGGGGQREG